MEMEMDIITGVIDPQHIDSSLVGGKAHKLIALNWLAHQAGSFRIPRFCILPATLCETYDRERGGPPLVVYPSLPAPHALSEPVIAYYEDFYSTYAMVFERWAKRIDPAGQPFLRSSLVVEHDDARSFAGVNYSLRPLALLPGQRFLSYALPRLLAGMYRPYTEWYLRRHELHKQNRSAAIMFSEFIEKKLIGIAYVLGGSAYIDCNEVPDRQNPEPVAHNIGFALAHTRRSWPGYWRQHRRGERLRRALNDFASCQKPGSCWEIEFCLDMANDIYLMQYRSLPSLTSSAHHLSVAAGAHWMPNALHVPIYHTVGRAEGRVRMLMDRDRTPTAIREVIESSRRAGEAIVWVVHLQSDQQWDGFALAWLLAQECISGPLQVILCHAAVRRRMHLTRAMHEDPGVRFVSEMSLKQIALLSDDLAVEIDSDGFSASIRPLS
jgi:hypothetical protein